MPLITEHSDGLAFLDPAPTAEQKAHILSLIGAELSPSHTTTLHPAVPTSYTPSFPAGISALHARLAAKDSSSTGAEQGSEGAAAEEGEEKGISTSRYEALSAPPATSTASVELYAPLVRQAYATSTYLADREAALEQLERHGRNAWLTANFQLEPVQRALDAELAEAKRQLDEVQAARRRRQHAAGAEMHALDRAWSDGVGRLVRVEVANAELRERILAKRAEAAS